MKLSDFSTIFFVDIQSARDNEGHLFVKELCVLHYENRFFLHGTYRVPEYVKNQEYIGKFDKANKWTMKNYHQIALEDGVRPYKSIFSDLKRMKNQMTNGKMLIYMVGREKVRLLENLLHGYENSRKINDLNPLQDIVIFDTISNRSQGCTTSNDIRNLSLHATADERRQFLNEKFFSAKRDACIYHVSPNCAKLNCYYMLTKYYQQVKRLESLIADTDESEEEEDD